MAEALILDSEAVNALARAKGRPVLAERARAILKVAHDESALVRVPAPVLAEVYRGGAVDASLDHLLNGRGIVVFDLNARIARRAGALLALQKLNSAHAVDAFVVATALEFSSAVIATGDPDDLRRLASGSPQVRIFAI
ncbi:MAG: PIN domain-containing protein [Polyangiales bacterium]